MASRNWTEKEFQQAWLLKVIGHSDAEIGNAIGRSAAAVAWQLRYGGGPIEPNSFLAKVERQHSARHA